MYRFSGALRELACSVSRAGRLASSAQSQATECNHDQEQCSYLLPWWMNTSSSQPLSDLQTPEHWHRPLAFSRAIAWGRRTGVAMHHRAHCKTPGAPVQQAAANHQPPPTEPAWQLTSTCCLSTHQHLAASVRLQVVSSSRRPPAGKPGTCKPLAAAAGDTSSWPDTHTLLPLECDVASARHTPAACLAGFPHRVMT
jgi:hypothetical protein